MIHAICRCDLLDNPRLRPDSGRLYASAWARSRGPGGAVQVLGLWTCDPGLRAQLMRLRANDAVTVAGALVARVCTPAGSDEQKPLVLLRVDSLEAESAAAPEWPRNRRSWGTVVQFPTSPKPVA